MARYIDADKLIAHLKDEIKECEIPFGSRANGKGVAYGTALGLKSAISFVETLSTADVVPKSEVDKWYYEYHAIKDELKQERIYHKATEKLADKYCVELITAKTEVETLKDNNEHLAVMLEETKAEVERLQAQKDALIKNYAECMKDYAREIFADVNMQIFPYSTDIYINGEELIIIPKSDYNAILDEIKKKYTEGEDKPAATEEKYFSPEDVSKMTPQEVREKYTSIRRSMERW